MRLWVLVAAVSPASGALDLPSLSGWSVSGTAPDEYEVRLDESAGRNGSACAVLETRAPKTSGFVSLMQTAPMSSYRGRRLQLTAWVKAKDVKGWSGLWMRIDNGKGKGVAFDNMQDRPVRGSSGWKDYSIVLDVPPEAAKASFGIILEGAGTVWVDDFAFSFVGPEVPVTDYFGRHWKKEAQP